MTNWSEMRNSGTGKEKRTQITDMEAAPSDTPCQDMRGAWSAAQCLKKIRRYWVRNIQLHRVCYSIFGAGCYCSYQLASNTPMQLPSSVSTCTFQSESEKWKLSLLPRRSALQSPQNNSHYFDISTDLKGKSLASKENQNPTSQPSSISVSLQCMVAIFYSRGNSFWGFAVVFLIKM